jgi:hypothetical protein
LAWLVGATRAGDRLPDEIGVEDHLQGYDRKGEAQHNRQYDKPQIGL